MTTKNKFGPVSDIGAFGGEAFYKTQLEIANREKNQLQERLREVETKNAHLLKSIFELSCAAPGAAATQSMPIDIVQALKKLSISADQTPGQSGKGSAYRRAAPIDRAPMENTSASGISVDISPAYTPFRCRAELKGHSAAVYAIQFSPNGQLLVSTSFDKSVCFWPMDRFLEKSNYDPKLSIPDAHRAPCVAVEWTFDSACAVTGGLDQTTAEWDVESGCYEAISRFQCNGLVNAISVSPANDALFFVGTSRNAVHLFDRRVARLYHSSSFDASTQIMNDSAINSIHVTLDGMRFITGDHTGAIKTFDLRMSGIVHPGEKRSSLIDVTYNDDNRRPITHVHTSPPTFGEDYGRFMAVNSYDNYLRVYDRGSFVLKGEKPQLKPVHSLQGLHNTHWPIKSSFFLGADYRPPQSVRSRYKQRRSRDSDKRPREISNNEISPEGAGYESSSDETGIDSYGSEGESVGEGSLDGDCDNSDKGDAVGGPIEKSLILASGSADCNIYIFDVGGRSGTGSLLQRLEGHRDRVYGVDFHPSEPILVSCSADSAIKIWQSSR